MDTQGLGFDGTHDKSQAGRLQAKFKEDCEKNKESRRHYSRVDILASCAVALQ